MTTEEIKELIENNNCTFRIRGFNSRSQDKFRIRHTEYSTGKLSGVTDGFYSMNINKFGPTCITLYTFDMFSNRTTGKIKYEDIYDLEVIEDTKKQMFKKGDKITLNTGYRCDTGTVIRCDDVSVTWESVLGSIYTSPFNKYNITLLNN